MTRTARRLVRHLSHLSQLSHLSHLSHLKDRYAAARHDRGDVPGWVLITVMTAGLVTALWVFAGPALTDIFGTAINSVKGP